MASASGSIICRLGPNILSPAIPFSRVEQINLDFVHQVGRIDWNTAQGDNKFIEWDLSLTSLFSDAITSFAHVITIDGT